MKSEAVFRNETLGRLVMSPFPAPCGNPFCFLLKMARKGLSWMWFVKYVPLVGLAGHE